MDEKILLNKNGIQDILDRLSSRIVEDIADLGNFAVVGIQTRGVELARRLKERIEKNTSRSIQSGTLDITFYRDDLATRGVLPVIKETRIEFNITKKTILLVDDVIFTGRTTKAAIETLMSFGRPSAIRLFALVDRGNRELPIQPDYCGFTVKTSLKDNVQVFLRGIDEAEDSVVITRES